MVKMCKTQMRAGGSAAPGTSSRSQRSSLLRTRDRSVREGKLWGLTIVLSTRPVKNRLPTFPQRECDTWVGIEDETARYEVTHYMLFRVRSSRLTTTHNMSGHVLCGARNVAKCTIIFGVFLCTRSKLTATRTPPRFEHVFKDFFSTHSRYQRSQRKGERNQSSRFRGCVARFTAPLRDVSAIGGTSSRLVVISRQGSASTTQQYSSSTARN
ncbi:hypothetical protein PybrP1_006937, partial [[Pythium] brassicae (nom. inval.)]